MSAGNSVTIIGRLTKDPVLRKTKGDKSVVNFSIARNERRGETEAPLFIDVTAWGKTAEALAQYRQKGDQVCVLGRLDVDEYTDKEGNQRSNRIVVADHIEFLARAKANEKANGAATDGSTASATRNGEAELEELRF